MTVRHTMTFTGTVQRVGFRATTHRLAGGFDVTGWVRNEDDGSVTCVAEGQEDELKRFRAAIEYAMGGLIEDIRVDVSAATGEFDRFTIER